MFRWIDSSFQLKNMLEKLQMLSCLSTMLSSRSSIIPVRWTCGVRTGPLRGPTSGWWDPQKTHDLHDVEVMFWHMGWLSSYFIGCKMITDFVGTLVLLPFAFALFIYFYCTFQAFICWIVELKYDNDNDYRMWTSSFLIVKNVGSQKWYSKLKVNELPWIPLKSFQHKLIFTSMDDLPSA